MQYKLKDAAYECTASLSRRRMVSCENCYQSSATFTSSKNVYHQFTMIMVRIKNVGKLLSTSKKNYVLQGQKKNFPSKDVRRLLISSENQLRAA